MRTRSCCAASGGVPRAKRVVVVGGGDQEASVLRVNRGVVSAKVNKIKPTVLHV